MGFYWKYFIVKVAYEFCDEYIIEYFCLEMVLNIAQQSV